MRTEAPEQIFCAVRKTLKHQSLLIPVVGLSIMAACMNPSELRQLSVTASPIPSVSDLRDLPAIPPIVPDPRSRNFCEPVSERSDPVYQALRGTPVPAEEVVGPPLPPGEALQTSSDYPISPADIVRTKPVNLRNYQVLLLGVGYSSEELPDKMERLMEVYEKAYSKISVQFSYLSFSAQLKVDHIGRLGALAKREEYNRLMNKIRQVDVIDTGIIIMNTAERFGGCCPPIAAGESKKTYVDANHELAHQLGLYDGDKITGQFKEEGEGIRNEAVFTKTATLKKDVKAALRITQTQIFYMGGNCNGEPVFTIGDPARDIMINYLPDNEDFLNIINRGEDVFDPTQIVIMDNNAKKFARRRIVTSP